MSCCRMVPGWMGDGANASSCTIRSMSAMPVAPLIGTALARHSLKPFHSAVLCEAVMITLPSAPRLPLA